MGRPIAPRPLQREPHLPLSRPGHALGRDRRPQRVFDVIPHDPVQHVAARRSRLVGGRGSAHPPRRRTWHATTRPANSGAYARQRAERWQNLRSAAAETIAGHITIEWLARSTNEVGRMPGKKTPRMVGPTAPRYRTSRSYRSHRSKACRLSGTLGSESSPGSVIASPSSSRALRRARRQRPRGVAPSRRTLPPTSRRFRAAPR